MSSDAALSLLFALGLFVCCTPFTGPFQPVCVRAFFDEGSIFCSFVGSWPTRCVENVERTASVDLVDRPFLLRINVALWQIHSGMHDGQQAETLFYCLFWKAQPEEEEGKNQCKQRPFIKSKQRVVWFGCQARDIQNKKRVQETESHSLTHTHTHARMQTLSLCASLLFVCQVSDLSGGQLDQRHSDRLFGSLAPLERLVRHKRSGGDGSDRAQANSEPDSVDWRRADSANTVR